jgi:DNA-binding CsgD family transcriptional regulator
VDESTESLVSRAHHVLELAAREGLLDFPARGILRGWAGLDAALATAEQQLWNLAEACSGGADTAAQAASAMVLSREAAVVRNSLLTWEMGRRHEATHKADQALQRLRSAATVDEFVSILPHEIVDLGYLRALFSWVDQMRWVARSAHSINGSAESKLLVQVGQQRPFRDLRGMFEFEMVQRRQPILHHGIRKSDRVHPDLIKVTQSDALLGVPLMSGNSVVGFVSLDVNLASGTVDEFDRDLMGFLLGGAGIALDRIHALEGLSTLQTDAERISEAAQALLGKLGHTISPVATDFGRPFAHQELPAGPPAQYSSILTRREEQVLELVARGLTNSQIGDRLYITEGTAKSHVKSVLRKLEVSNRTEAAAIYRQQGTSRG